MKGFEDVKFIITSNDDNLEANITLDHDIYFLVNDSLKLNLEKTIRKIADKFKSIHGAEQLHC